MTQQHIEYELLKTMLYSVIYLYDKTESTREDGAITYIS